MPSSRTATIPSLVYGTAWKKDKTRELVRQAISSGFRGIDTAAQPKHYQEELVGDGIRDAISSHALRRGDLYIQTKFTSIHGQDPTRLPYDASTSITEQVKASVASSLHNLRHSDGAQEANALPYIDCLILHSPYPSMVETEEAWHAMESYVPSEVLTLGISNIYQPQVLQALYKSATVKPSVVQNRFYAATRYDQTIREFCHEHGIKYQSFWTLTANPELLKSEVVGAVTKESDVSRPVALYALVIGLGNVSVLDGTTNLGRMKEDAVGVAKVEKWASVNAEKWTQFRDLFEDLLRTTYDSERASK